MRKTPAPILKALYSLSTRLTLVGMILASAFTHAEEICPGLQINTPLFPRLSPNEKALVCGSLHPASDWRTIPNAQKKTHLTRMLQNRGYLTPQFLENEKGTLVVLLSGQSKLKSLRVVFEQDSYPFDSQWDWNGRTLTPSLLDEIQSTIAGELYDEGFPCASVRATVARPKSGEVVATVRTGSQATLLFEDFSLSPALQQQYGLALLSRYFAFGPGQPFSQTKLGLSARRMERSGLVESVSFIPQCQGNALSSVRLMGSVSAPRLLRLGVGIDTEGILKLRSIWRHARLGSQASSLEVKALASSYLQELNASINWYMLPTHPRLHALPSLFA